jgi:hypothetical protein
MALMKSELSLDLLIQEAGLFARKESIHFEPSIYGVTDGKAIGTYFERKFQVSLASKYVYEPGSSASGIDFPGLGVDMKVTRVTQPQSSCPFRSARQKIYGLGYALMGIRQILQNEGNLDDIVAFMEDRHLPVGDIQARELAEEILHNPPEIGYLTISNALQWRLQYSRVIEKAGEVDGILRIR